MHFSTLWSCIDSS